MEELNGTNGLQAEGRAVRAIRDTLDRRSILLLVFAPLLALFAATAQWGATVGTPYHIDAFTNAVTAWHLGVEGTPISPEMADAAQEDHLGNLGWFVSSRRGPVALYPPGAALLGAPIYAVVRPPLEPTELQGSNRPDLAPISTFTPPVWPATLAAVLSTALTVTFLTQTAIEFGLSRPVAVLSGWVVGLGTGLWSVAADQLWQHGPATMWIGLALLLGAKRRFAGAGLAMGAAVLTRPITGIIFAAIVLAVALGERGVRAAARLAVGAIPGVLALLMYNWWLFGSPSLRGGYGTRFDERFVDGSLSSYGTDVLLGLFAPYRGVLAMSPFIAVLLLGVRTAWRSASLFERGAAVGALLYVLFSWRAESFAGGGGFWSYRYPLEAVVAVSPLLARSLAGFALPSSFWRRWVVWTAAVAVAWHLPAIY